MLATVHLRAHEYEGHPGTEKGAEDEDEHAVEQATDGGNESADFEEEEKDGCFDEGEDGRVDYVECYQDLGKVWRLVLLKCAEV